MRQRQILGDRFANPPIPAILPIGKTAWWDGVKSGKYPKPVKLGPNMTAWRQISVEAANKLGDAYRKALVAETEGQLQEAQSRQMLEQALEQGQQQAQAEAQRLQTKQELMDLGIKLLTQRAPPAPAPTPTMCSSYVNGRYISTRCS